jgi:hypothetical protein
MAPDVTAEAGLYSGAGDPLNGAQVAISRDGRIRLFASSVRRISGGYSIDEDRATFQA